MRAHLKKEQEEIEALAHMLAAEEDDEPFDPGERKKKPVSTKPWMPRLNEPTQAIMFNDPADLVVGYGPKYTGKCWRSDTCVIYTATGMKRLRAMRPDVAPDADGFSPIDQRVIAFDGERLVESRASQYYSESSRQAITLDLANGGEITGSPRHPIWCCYPGVDSRGAFGYLSLSDLVQRIEQGQRIWTPFMGHPSFSGGTNVVVAGVEIDEEVGYLLGLDCLRCFKRIPDLIVESPRPVVSAFLRGLFDTEGTVCKNTGSIQLCTTSELLSLDVQLVMAAFGIMVVRRSKKSTGGQPAWTLYITKEWAGKFASEIGFGITGKQALIANRPAFRTSNRGSKRHHYGYPKHICRSAEELKNYTITDTWIEIKSARNSEHDLADLSVDDTHSFVAGGFINHNTVGLGHKIFRHCWQEFDALFSIIGVSAESLGQGICHDLQSLVGPTWRDGNREPMYLRQGGILVPNPKAGELIDDGLGIQYSKWKIDPVSKRMWMWVQNRHGGKSCIRVASIPHPSMIEDRITGPAPSGIMLEEATKCRGEEYFRFPSLQLYRRRDIVGPQQFLMACNPEGPDHWVYDVCWNQCERAPDQPHRAWPEDRVKPGILRDPGVSVYFCSYEENAHNVSQKNRDIVERGLRKDPIQRQRLIEGKWVSYPSGEALFKDQFSEPIHVRGDAKRNEGLLPMLEYPIIIGYDIGSVNTGISMKQYIPTEDGEVEIVFDELCFYRTRKKVKSVAHVMLEKMRYWTQFLWDSVGYDPDNPPTDEYGEPKPMPVWKFWHIAGDDATTTYNPSKGSTYARDIEQDSRNFIEANPQRYAGIEPIHIRGCPKPPESIKRRVDFTAEALTEGRVFISATCAWHRQMFLHLERADQEGVPKSEHKYGHTFDGYSYPRLYRELKLPEGFKPDDGEPAFEVSTG